MGYNSNLVVDFDDAHLGSIQVGYVFNREYLARDASRFHDSGTEHHEPVAELGRQGQVVECANDGKSLFSPQLID